MPRPHPCAALGACAVLLLGTASQAQTTRLTITQDGAGTLFVGNGAPGDKQVKIEVGPLAGQVRVIDGAAPGPQAFSGIRAIRVATGAGTDQIELDMNASQSLALSIDSGAGDANMKLQWKVPPGAASTVSALDMASGGGRLNIELDHESETPEASFQWTTRFGGGDKLIKGGVEFKEGVRQARQNIAFTQLGGGSHLVAMEVESKAADATLLLDTGAAQDVLYKVISPDRSTRLVADTTVAGAKNNIEILSAAPTTSVRLAGGTANVPLAETSFGVVQTVPGSLGAQLDFTTRSASSKFGAKFDGAFSTLTLGGRLAGGSGRDELKLETNARALASLLVDAGGGDNAVDFLASAALLATASPLRLVTGAGSDLVTLLAGIGSTAAPRVDCGAGNDSAKLSVGTTVGCELVGP
jgi:hypothetical protein